MSRVRVRGCALCMPMYLSIMMIMKKAEKSRQGFQLTLPPLSKFPWFSKFVHFYLWTPYVFILLLTRTVLIFLFTFGSSCYKKSEVELSWRSKLSFLGCWMYLFPLTFVSPINRSSLNGGLSRCELHEVIYTSHATS